MLSVIIPVLVSSVLTLIFNLVCTLAFNVTSSNFKASHVILTPKRFKNIP